MQVLDVPVAAAGTWIKEGFALFRRQPVAWISLLSSWLMFSVVIVLIVPLVGPALATMLQPGLFAGFALAARDQIDGKPVVLGHLFAGFRINGRALLTVGSVTLLIEILVVLLMGTLGFPREIPVDASGMPDVRAYALLLDGKEWIALLGFGLMLLIKAILWFSAPLLVLHPMPASHAIRWSFYAFVANFVPLAIFGAMMMTLFFFAVIPWMLGLLVWMPLYAIAHFVSYRHVFRPD